MAEPSWGIEVVTVANADSRLSWLRALAFLNPALTWDQQRSIGGKTAEKSGKYTKRAPRASVFWRFNDNGDFSLYFGQAIRVGPVPEKTIPPFSVS